MGLGLLAYDLIFFNVATIVYGGAAFAGFHAFRLFAAYVPWWVALFPAFFVALVAVIVEVGVLSALCPRLVPGRYTMMKGKVFYGWLLRSMLRRLVMWPPLRWIIFSSNALRWLALRAMGARIAFASNMSADADILDPQLLVVDRGATIGARCILSGHYVEKGMLVLGEVRVGEGSLLAVEVGVAPGVTIGPRVQINGRVSISVGVTIGADARIGGEALIDTGATIGEKARVGTRVHVAPRSEIPAHARLDAAVSSSSTTSSAAPAV